MEKHAAGWEAAALKAEAQRDAAIDERDALRAENELLRKLVDLLADDLHLIELGYVLAEKSTPANLRRAILAAKPDIATARAALST